nr:putative ribonuclease H-like domain-containing protein [Tanacetum cinerariifolium]
ENKFNVAGSGPIWMFDIDTLTKSMNYQPVTAGKKPEFEGEKPESETKKEAKGKSPVELSTGYRNLSAEFEDYSDTSINKVNAADSLVPAIKRLTQINNEDFHTCMFAYFLLQEEPKRVHQALKDPSWIEAMKEELLQFKMQKENKFNVAGSGPIWLFDIDTLTKSMNYQPVTAGNQSNPSAGVQELFDAEKAGEENVQRYVLFPLWSSSTRNPQNT